MDSLQTILYEQTGRVARITLNRPARGNGITFAMPVELAACVERANLDPTVHVILLAGNGPGFCSGYDLVEFAEQQLDADAPAAHDAPAGSPRDPRVVAANHDPAAPWDAMIDYAMMSRNVRCFMSLFHGEKPVVCKVHGFCVGGGTDIALCADLLLIEDEAKFGYPPARMWGSPTTALWAYRVGLERAKRLLFTGDCLSGKEAHEWGLAIEAPSAAQLDERAEVAGRTHRATAREPVDDDETVAESDRPRARSGGNADARHTLRCRCAPHARRLRLSTTRRRAGFKQAVRERDEPFGDLGRSTYKP